MNEATPLLLNTDRKFIAGRKVCLPACSSNSTIFDGSKSSARACVHDLRRRLADDRDRTFLWGDSPDMRAIASMIVGGGGGMTKSSACADAANARVNDIANERSIANLRKLIPYGS